MDNKDYPKVRREALRQGWRVIPIANGELFLAPDGVGKATWHRRHASSHPHALDDLVRRLKQAGFDAGALGR
ncbi:MAG TPA: hypothetical protein VFK59_00920 [Actinomycetota bacterium]|nr:hypothetical protein [Actinomycetota bacterium]